MKKFQPVWQAPDSPTGGADTAASQAPEPAPAPTGPDLSFIPEAFKGEDGAYDLTGFQKHYSSLTAAQQAAADAAAALPEDPSGYDLSMPEMDLSEIGLGKDYAMTLSDDPMFTPLLDEFRSTLHELKLPAEAGQKILGLMGKYEAMKEVDYQKSMANEKTQMGSRADQRISEAEQWIKGKDLPPSQMNAVSHLVKTAGGLDFIEKMMALQNSSSPNANPNANPDPMASVRARYPSET